MIMRLKFYTSNGHATSVNFTWSGELDTHFALGGTGGTQVRLSIKKSKVDVQGITCFKRRRNCEIPQAVRYSRRSLEHCSALISEN